MSSFRSQVLWRFGSVEWLWGHFFIIMMRRGVIFLEFLCKMSRYENNFSFMMMRRVFLFEAKVFWIYKFNLYCIFESMSNYEDIYLWWLEGVKGFLNFFFNKQILFKALNEMETYSSTLALNILSHLSTNFIQKKF